MRIRTIKPEFFTHEGIYEAELQTQLPLRLAFVGLWCAADREGRFKWEPRRLGVLIMPYDLIDFSRVLDALVTRGFVRKYEVRGVVYGCIPSFTRHQMINNREKPSALPEPNEYKGLDACATRGERVNDASLIPSSGREGKGREGKGREGEGEGNAQESDVTLPPEEPKPCPPPSLDSLEVLDGLVTKINDLKPSWRDSPHLTQPELYDLHKNKIGLLAIPFDVWENLKDWAKSPEGKEDWIMKTRSRFLTNYTESLMKSADWRAKEGAGTPSHLSLGGRKAQSTTIV